MLQIWYSIINFISPILTSSVCGTTKEQARAQLTAVGPDIAFALERRQLCAQQRKKNVYSASIDDHIHDVSVVSPPRLSPIDFGLIRQVRECSIFLVYSQAENH